MNKILSIFAILLFASCTANSPEGETSPNIPKDSIVSPTIIQKEFKIKKFQEDCDVLLAQKYDGKYRFDIQTDTFIYGKHNSEIFPKGHGTFSTLYGDTSQYVVRHYIHVKNTRKPLRIYLAEAKYPSQYALKKQIEWLEESMNFEMGCPGCTETRKMRLSPIHDYVMTSTNTLFWVNASYSYSQKEFADFVELLKSNVDTNEFKGRIYCPWGKDCMVEGIP